MREITFLYATLLCIFGVMEAMKLESQREREDMQIFSQKTDDSFKEHKDELLPEPKHKSLGKPHSNHEIRQGTVLACGSHSLVTGVNYVIKSSNYPSLYPKYHSCNWSFSASGADSISVTCSSFNVYKADSSCTGSYLAFSGGNLNAKYCGKLNTFTATSYASYMTVAFRTNDIQATGFSCDVYAKKGTVIPSVTTTTSKPVATTKPSVSGCRCGKVNRATRIFGGIPTEIHEYPWQVYLLYIGHSLRGPWCGGSIISKQWILTATHCIINDPDEGLYYVVIGDHNWNTASETSYTKKMTIAKFYIRNGYDNETIDNDITLIKLSATITFPANNKIAPICLPPADNLYENVQAIVTGWGKTEGPSNHELREVTVPTMSNTKCKAYMGATSITNNMICAGLDAGGKDSCQGDSGGPLITAGNTPQTYMIQIGVVSWGYECAEPKQPGVYTRVNRYLDWIKSTTGSLTSCPPA